MSQKIASDTLVRIERIAGNFSARHHPAVREEIEKGIATAVAEGQTAAQQPPLSSEEISLVRESLRVSHVVSAKRNRK